ncbi:MAG: hypothetical protein SWE60_11730 [Thermodesulfobacteriota bacterium]|nr:hypothetical protein [Thermodesulfobacteriota bacterium]
MMFLDPEKPIATCESDSCDDCAIRSVLHCHFSLKDWIHFLFIAFPPFLLGGAGIYYMNGWLLIPWIIFVVAFFGFIEIRVMCSHCPHYAESLTSLKCWANYGSPKLWKYRPGPMTIIEKTIFFGGFAIVWGYPLLFLILGKQPFLLLVYSMTTIGFFMTMMTFMCSQCINFACPLNCVDENVRSHFFDRNPTIAEAWGRFKNKRPD